jgi:hypothetical protein
MFGTLDDFSVLRSTCQLVQVVGETPVDHLGGRTQQKGKLQLAGSMEAKKYKLHICGLPRFLILPFFNVKAPHFNSHFWGQSLSSHRPSIRFLRLFAKASRTGVEAFRAANVCINILTMGYDYTYRKHHIYQ